MTAREATLSPTLNFLTASPFSTISPTNSWPRMKSGGPFKWLQCCQSPCKYGTHSTDPLYGCRSEPHKPLLLTLRIASVGFWILGMGRSSTATCVD